MKKIFISILMCCFIVVGVFGLAACGEIPVDSIKQSYTAMKETFEKYAKNDEGVTLFSFSESNGLKYNITISYGTKINEKISESTSEGFSELNSIYNSILSISYDYIMQNESYFNGLTDADLGENSKKALKNVSDSFNSFIGAIPNFVKEMNILEDFLKTGIVDSNNRGVEAYLRAFKKVYGDFVERNINLSTSIANFIETTEFFNIIKSTNITAANFELVKDYIRAKMLPIYSNFMMSKIENNYNFKESDKGDGYAKIDSLLKSLQSSFNNYKSQLVTSTPAKLPSSDNEINQNMMNLLFDYFNMFFSETNDYFAALNGINFEQLSINYKNNIESYKAANKDVERYFDKLEQFIIGNGNGGVLNTFIEKVNEIIY